MADPATGALIDLEPDAYERVTARLKEAGVAIEGVRQTRRVYKRAFKCGRLILEKGDNPCRYGFTYACMTGKRDRNSGTFYGVVQAMKDPQRWANKWLSQVLHVINSNAKGGLLAERGAFDNPRKAEEQWADPASITWLKDGALGAGKVQPKPLAQYPAGLDQLMQFAVNSIRDVTGVNVELMGLADRAQAGVLEYQRKQAGFTILGTLFDSLRRHRKQTGRLLLHFIQAYLPEGTLIRIVGPSGARFVPFARAPETAHYDVIVDEAPQSPSQKDKVWAVVTTMLPLLANFDLPLKVWTELLRYSPLPESLTLSITQALNEAHQGAAATLPPAVLADAQRLAAQTRVANANLALQREAMMSDLAMKRDLAAAELSLKAASAGVDGEKVSDLLRAKRKKRVVMLRDKQGRIAGADVVEVDERPGGRRRGAGHGARKPAAGA